MHPKIGDFWFDGSKKPKDCNFSGITSESKNKFTEAILLYEISNADYPIILFISKAGIVEIILSYDLLFIMRFWPLFCISFISKFLKILKLLFNFKWFSRLFVN